MATCEARAGVNALERLGRRLLLTVLLLLPVSATAGLEEGRAAYERGDYHTAYRELLPLAVADDDLAQIILGMMHHYGQGTPQDHAEAARSYRRSAEHGHPVAQVLLGVLLRDGLGVPQNLPRPYSGSVKLRCKDLRLRRFN
jgi:TPR repeat protein